MRFEANHHQHNHSRLLHIHQAATDSEKADILLRRQLHRLSRNMDVTFAATTSALQLVIVKPRQLFVMDDGHNFASIKPNEHGGGEGGTGQNAR